MGNCHSPYPKEFTLFKDDCLPFDVFVGDTWYHIDAEHPVHEQYVDVPIEIQKRVEKSINSALAKGGSLLGYAVDPAPYYEESLREEFDDVRSLGFDFVPEVVI